MFLLYCFAKRSEGMSVCKRWKVLLQEVMKQHFNSRCGNILGKAIGKVGNLAIC